MLKKLYFALSILLLVLSVDAVAQGYVSIAKKDPRLEEIFKDLQTIKNNLGYFQNRGNDAANANLEIETAVTNAMFDLQLFFGNNDAGDPEFYSIFSNARNNLTEAEVDAILNQSGMFREINDPISGDTYVRLERLPGYRDHDNGQNKKWRAHVAAIKAFELEVIQYMRYLMNTLTNMGVRTFVSKSENEITLKPLSNALQEAIEDLDVLKRKLVTIEDE